MENAIIKKLKKIAKEQDLINVSIKNCLDIINGDEVLFEEYCSSKFIDKVNFTKTDIELKFFSQCLYFENIYYDCTKTPLIETKILMFTNKTILLSEKTLEIGYYKLITDLNGNFYDEFFVIY